MLPRLVKDRLLLSLQADVFPGSRGREMVNQPQRRLLHPRSYAHEKGQFEDGSEHDLLVGQPLDLVKDGLALFPIELAVLLESEDSGGPSFTQSRGLGPADGLTDLAGAQSEQLFLEDRTAPIPQRQRVAERVQRILAESRMDATARFQYRAAKETY